MCILQLFDVVFYNSRINAMYPQIIAKIHQYYIFKSDPSMPLLHTVPGFLLHSQQPRAGVHSCTFHTHYFTLPIHTSHLTDVRTL